MVHFDLPLITRSRMRSLPLKVESPKTIISKSDIIIRENVSRDAKKCDPVRHPNCAEQELKFLGWINLASCLSSDPGALGTDLTSSTVLRSAGIRGIECTTSRPARRCGAPSSRASKDASVMNTTTTRYGMSRWAACSGGVRHYAQNARHVSLRHRPREQCGTGSTC